MTTDPLAEVLALAPHAERLDEQTVRLATSKTTLTLRVVEASVCVTTTRGGDSIPHAVYVKPKDLVAFIGGVLVGYGVVNAPINRPHERDGVYAAHSERWAIKFAVTHFRKELATIKAHAATAAPEDGYHIRAAYEMRRRIALAGEKP